MRMKAYEHLKGFHGQSKFYTWIVRIAVNESLMKLRKRKGDRFVSLDEPIDTGEEEVKREIAVWEGNPEQQYSQEELQGILNEAVETLKPDFRTVFVLRDIEEMNTEETAECLNLSQENVKVRLHRARAVLRRELYARAGATSFHSFQFHAVHCDRVVKNVFRILGLSN